MPEHSTLTGSQLHEMKGAASASSGQVPIANGAGGTSFTTPPWNEALSGTTDNSVPKHDGTDGALQESGVTIDDNDVITAGGVIAGDPGTEGSGITVGGSTYDSVLKVSDLGGTNVAMSILHRHSTSLAPLLVSARSHSDTSSHAVVQNGDSLFTLYGTGWDGSDYAIGASMSFVVSDTPGAGDMPTDIVFSVSPNGSETPVEGLRLASDGTVTYSGRVFQELKYKDADNTAVNNSTTLVDDEDLAGFTLDASSVYKVEGDVYVTSANGTTNVDMAFQLVSGTLADSQIRYTSYHEDGDNIETEEGAITDEKTVTSISGTVPILVHISGFVSVTNAAVLDLQFAQNVAAATDTQTLKGSWLQFTKVS